MHKRSSVGDERFLRTSSDVTNQWPGLVSRRCRLWSIVAGELRVRTKIAISPPNRKGEVQPPLLPQYRGRSQSIPLEQVVAIHSGMAAEWSGLVNSHAKPVEVYSQKVMSGS
ncbi:hypothetical protein TNCV_4598891 [Trichonephila clavipes]|nr:hypothetical protein TNCV_4598891 [Trichonephila clavipes]